jgi:hypothetical protein
VHRLLKQFQEAGDAKAVLYASLVEFCRGRVATCLDGDLSCCHANDFLGELLHWSPLVIHQDDGKVALADRLD